jgi:hypothetical protein
MNVTFTLEAKNGNQFKSDYVLVCGVTIESTIKRLEDMGYKVLYYVAEGETVYCDGQTLQNELPSKGRGYRFSHYHQVITEYCQDKKIAHLAKVVWFGRATGRLSHEIAYFLDCATASKICKFLVKNRINSVDNYETTLKNLSI